MKLFLSILTVFWAVSGAAQAATLTYDDTLVDASDNRNTPTSVGSLSANGDTIEVTGGTDVDNGDIRDYFAFTSLTDFNFVLNSISIKSKGPTQQKPPSASFRIYSDDGLFVVLAHEAVRDQVSGAFFDTFAAGNYLVRLNANNPNAGVITGYSFNLNAPAAPNFSPSPVPVPAGLPLLASGFVLVAWMRRRKAA